MGRVAASEIDDPGFLTRLGVYSQDAIAAIGTQQLKKFSQIEKT
jgi:hypothetical protein